MRGSRTSFENDVFGRAGQDEVDLAGPHGLDGGRAGGDGEELDIEPGRGLQGGLDGAELLLELLQALDVRDGELDVLGVSRRGRRRNQGGGS